MDVPPKKSLAVTAEEIFVYALLHDLEHQLLSADRIEQLKADLKNPKSHISKFIEEFDERISSSRTADWSKVMATGFAHYFGKKPLPRKKPITVAHERQAILAFVRDAAENGSVNASIATDILAEGGEALSWMDSVADRILTQDLPLLEHRDSIVAMRTDLADLSPVLKGVIDEGNRNMTNKLREHNSGLATELEARLVDLRAQLSQGEDFSPPI